MNTEDWKNERSSLWQKYVNNEVLNYNTSCYTIIEREPSSVLQGRIAYIDLALNLGFCPQKNPCQSHKLPYLSLNKVKWFFKTSVKIQCTPTSSTKLREREYVFV